MYNTVALIGKVMTPPTLMDLSGGGSVAMFLFATWNPTTKGDIEYHTVVIRGDVPTEIDYGVIAHIGGALGSVQWARGDINAVVVLTSFLPIPTYDPGPRQVCTDEELKPF